MKDDRRHAWSLWNIASKAPRQQPLSSTTAVALDLADACRFLAHLFPHCTKYLELTASLRASKFSSPLNDAPAGKRVATAASRW